MVTSRFFERLYHNLWTGPRLARKSFSIRDKNSIRDVVKQSEEQHNSEIRVIVEGRLPLSDMLQGVTPRERAGELFSLHKIWNTEENSGILIYVLLSEAALEIICDRGVKGRVTVGEDSLSWEDILSKTTSETTNLFKNGLYTKGIIYLITQLTPWLVAKFPPKALDTNELPDTPMISSS